MVKVMVIVSEVKVWKGECVKGECGEGDGESESVVRVEL